MNSENQIPENKQKTFLGEVIEFLLHRKKWWLTPIILVLLLMGTLIFFAQGSALSPFIYTMF